MSERQREDFLQEFNEVDNLVAFAVMGGIFSESIDLIGDRLIGAVIVGVGLPQICFERNIIREYFDKIMGEGFNYAYTYPGMNKVMQAGGRVIRSEDDKGVILLIDDRYRTNIYRKLLPQEWSHYKKIGNPIDLEGLLKEFW